MNERDDESYREEEEELRREGIFIAHQHVNI